MWHFIFYKSCLKMGSVIENYIRIESLFKQKSKCQSHHWRKTLKNQEPEPTHFYKVLVKLFCHKGLQTWNDKGSGPVQNCLKAFLLKSFIADNVCFYAHWRISNNIFHYVTFERSKTTGPYNGNEASRLHYLTGLLTKLPGEHFLCYNHLVLHLKPYLRPLLLSWQD